MLNQIFKLNGAKYSDEQPTTMDGTPRKEFQKRIITDELAELPQGGEAVYYATGGGYKSNDNLIEHERKIGRLPPKEVVPSIRGNDYRSLPEFEAEKPKLREAIREYFKAVHGINASDAQITEQERTFYSNEVNTLIAKEIVKARIVAGQPVIHESASIYADTLERAKLAHDNEVKSVLIAGDMDTDKAINLQKSVTNEFNTAASYKIFAHRVKTGELEKAFDEIRIYNNDGPEPVLIAEKKKDGKLEVVEKHRALYDKFIAKADAIDLTEYMDKAQFKANQVSQELWQIVKERFDIETPQAALEQAEPGQLTPPPPPLPIKVDKNRPPLP